ncbi:unnamed protein product [Polarella glacialis]|uniref:RRM domain-containing protein n=2 Tax=Polarella glacialis TaxID=89957 RepID=A0A813GQM0_POLGL|nr:unnamed protein product [Polarella glacialis]
MSTTTIEIVEGCTERTSRLGLKKAMQIYGEIDACHMGDRAVMGANFTEFPLVRFKLQPDAEKALAALKSGQVYLDGIVLKGEWRGGTRRPQTRGETSSAAPRGEDEAGSRTLQEPPSVSSRGAKRSPSRRRKRSRSRSRSRRRRVLSPPAVKTASKVSALSLNTLALLLGLPENKDAGNSESTLSKNPLYRPKE